jgi:hypothetical protein
MSSKSPFNSFTESELRDYCKATLESLEHWLRRLIDEVLTRAYGSEYLDARRSDGSRVVKNEIRKNINGRIHADSTRFARPIDAALLDDVIDIICNPVLYRDFFGEAFKPAYPDGREEARTFLKRLVEPRNRLSHANSISVRQAEQIVCYANDVIDCLKQYYVQVGAFMEYNVPSIIKFSDSFGNLCHVDRHFDRNSSSKMLHFADEPRFFLRPGDTISIEVEVDQSFPATSYELYWGFMRRPAIRNASNRLELQIEESDVTLEFHIHCNIISKQVWHKFPSGVDDLLMLIYRVLPPL